MNFVAEFFYFRLAGLCFGNGHRFKAGETFILFPTCKGLHCILMPAQVGRDLSLSLWNGSLSACFILIEYYFYSYGSEMTIAVFVFLLKNHAP